MGGAWLGGKTGAAFGSLFGPIGASIGLVLGSLIGGVAASMAADRLVVSSMTKSIALQENAPSEQEKLQAFENAARNLNLESFEARDKETVRKEYKHLALRYHPDKHANSSPDVKAKAQEKFI